MTTPAVRMTGITKSFPGVKALDGVDLEIRAGEVMALVGENGAGKSTIIKILAGSYIADAGSVEIGGEAVQMTSPRDSQKRGIAVIHQELSLAPHLSVAENIWVGREPRTRLGLVDFGRMRRESATLLADLGIRIDPDDLVGRLSIARQQSVEIAKALAVSADIVVMDEPTSSLTEDEVDLLLGIVQRLRDRGVAVLYVSHRFREIFEISDRITVLRDGKSVGEILETADVTAGEVVNLMVGRDLQRVFGERIGDIDHTAPILSVRGLGSGDKVRDVSFDLHPGEILGIAGLVGAGRSETVRAIFGVDRVDAGEIHFAGSRVKWTNARDAIRAGVGMVPEDRKGTGLFLDIPVAVNMASAATSSISRFGWLTRTRERAMTRDYAKQLGLRANALDEPVRSLSGGNQQKAVIARWLATKPRVLLLDEPTRGVDMGAKAEIYGLIRKIASTGVAVLMVSSELNEILGMSDRVVVFREGVVTGELAGTEIEERAVMSMATGVTQEDAA